ncbi:MAG: D-TA family PLP-dependent enzyme [Chitinophagaceae bacterium]|nr:MAG: D-TA family PLP-dependent enzyme [Chitinophagaceae bacterium]
MQWFELNDTSRIDSPAMLVYQSRVEENIRQCLSLAKSVELLRPHVKTSKIAEVCQLMLDYGIRKFKCATIAEGEMLGLVNAPDVLLAYQPVGPKADRLFHLVKKFPSTAFSCLVDNPAIANELSEKAVAAGLVLPVYIDLNIGMNRTGVSPDKAWEVYEKIKSLEGLAFAGLHAYDGQIHDKDPEQNRSTALKGFSAVEVLAAALRDAGETGLVIVAGGSVTYPVYREMDVESSPGTFVFWDQGYKTMMPKEPFEFAAIILTRVVSVLENGLVCIDLGHKSVASENPLPRVFFLNEPDAVPVSHSEEHMVVQLPAGKKYEVGAVFYAVPVHICPSISMYEEVSVVNNQAISGTWKVISRNKKITI